MAEAENPVEGGESRGLVPALVQNPESQALVPVLADSDLQTLLPKIPALVQSATALVIGNVEQRTQATDILNMIAKAKKALEARRKAFVEPFNSQVMAINDWFKSTRAPLEQVDEPLRNRALQFDQEQERMRREEEARLRALQAKEHAKQVAKAEKKGQEPPLPPPIVAVPGPTQTVKGAAGKTTTMTDWTHEITDQSQIPAEYWMVNEAKLKAAVKAGVRNIPGVRIYEIQTLRVGGR